MPRAALLAWAGLALASLFWAGNSLVARAFVAQNSAFQSGVLALERGFADSPAAGRTVVVARA